MTRSGSLFGLTTLERLTVGRVPGSWPTPTASDAKLSRRHGYMKKGNPGTTLTDAVVIHHDGATRKGGERLSTEVGPSPAFIEALMGIPPSWTDVE
jgi:hypothetical protein